MKTVVKKRVNSKESNDKEERLGRKKGKRYKKKGK